MNGSVLLIEKDPELRLTCETALREEKLSVASDATLATGVAHLVWPGVPHLLVVDRLGFLELLTLRRLFTGDLAALLPSVVVLSIGEERDPGAIDPDRLWLLRRVARATCQARRELGGPLWRPATELLVQRVRELQASQVLRLEASAPVAADEPGRPLDASPMQS